MKLYSYTLAADDGAAPNPYGGVCTLAICKPGIRRTAELGDWIVGIGPTAGPNGENLSYHLVYAMKVSRTMTLAQYYHHCQRSLTAKNPDWSASAPFQHQVGDCIYMPNAAGKLVQLRGVHNMKDNYDVDVGGLNALLAEEVFYYFGDDPVRLPSEFERIRHPTQGHKVHVNDGVKADVVAWMEGGFGRDARPRILYGLPIHRAKVRPGDPSCESSCGVSRKDDQDLPSYC